MDGFWWLGTTFGVILFAYFTLSPFLEKIEKSMPKGLPKSMKIGLKIDFWQTFGLLCRLFGSFGRCQKMMKFWSRFGRSANLKKLAQWSPKGAPDANDQLLLAARVPRPASRATRKVERGQLARGKQARGKEGKWKSGKMEKWNGKEGKKERKRDLTRLLGQRPGEFYMISKARISFPKLF